MTEISGVRKTNLKAYEKIVASLLSSCAINPKFNILPPLIPKSDLPILLTFNQEDPPPPIVSDDFEKLKIGSLVQGRICNLKTNMIKVDLKHYGPSLAGVECNLPSTEISHTFVETAKLVFKYGEKLTCVVIAMDEERDTIDLSIKALEVTPGDYLIDKKLVYSTASAAAQLWLEKRLAEIALLPPPTLQTTLDEEETSYQHYCSTLPRSSTIRGIETLTKIRLISKEGQIGSLLQVVLRMIPPPSSNVEGTTRFKVVDFGGGTGHLALPLAMLRPDIDVVVLDLKQESLNIALERAQKSNCTNLQSVQLDIKDYTDHFGLGLALHACGEATDLALDRCVASKAAFVMAPCCVGKINSSKRHEFTYIFGTDRLSSAIITYPRSRTYKSLVTESDFNHLATAADYSDLNNMRSHRGSLRRTAKALLEWDRILYAKECGYKCVMTRMEPWESTPKNDLIIGWFEEKEVGPYGVDDVLCGTCDEANEDILYSKNQLLNGSDYNASTPSTSNGTQVDSQVKTIAPPEDSNDWTSAEVANLSQTFQTFLSSPLIYSNNEITNDEYRFHTGMGKRIRKLIHHVAETFGVRHWGVGHSNSTKIVVISRLRPKVEGGGNVRVTINEEGQVVNAEK